VDTNWKNEEATKNVVAKKLQIGGRNKFDLHDQKIWNMITKNV
jgi:hypothetical protein